MRFLLLSLVILLSGCAKQKLDGYKEYKIKEGKHSSVVAFNTLTHDVLTFDAIFDESAKYTTVDPANQYDINKLYGFSDCNQNHQKNSARFGWRWLNNKLEIHAYVYNNGERTSQFIDVVSLNKSHKYSIELYGDRYRFRLDDKKVDMSRTDKCDSGIYYMLYPYFGGDEKAPHDIKILIKEDKIRR